MGADEFDFLRPPPVELDAYTERIVSAAEKCQHHVPRDIAAYVRRTGKFTKKQWNAMLSFIDNEMKHGRWQGFNYDPDELDHWARELADE